MDDRTVVGRAVAIVGAVAAGPGPTTLAGLTARTGIPKPTVRRIANHLVAHKILTREPNGYRLATRLTDLGTAAARQLGTVDVAAPYVHELHSSSDQITWIASISDASLVILDTAFAHRHARLMAAAWPPIMTRRSMLGTAAGRLMVASGAVDPGELFDRGPVRRTPYTITNRRILHDRVLRAADTGVAVECEETRLGWWCGAVDLPGAAGTHIIGMTAELRRILPERGLSLLTGIAERLRRELASTG